MILELTDQQRQQLEQENGIVRLVDTHSRQTYVLVRADVYDRLQALFDEDATSGAADAYAASLPVLARSGWDDPEMDSYNALDPRNHQ